MTGRWLSDTSDKLYFVRSSRDLHRIDVCVADTSTGTSKVLIQERSNVYMDDRPLRLVDNGQELIWWSERDGWGHYYLYDARRQAEEPDHLRRIYGRPDSGHRFERRATCISPPPATSPDEDPYYVHLYRVNLDGSGLKLLDPGDL